MRVFTLCLASLACHLAVLAAEFQPGMHEAIGDGKVTLPDGRPAIAFDASAAQGTSATWRLPSPMTPGWHTVKIGFGQEVRTRKLVQFECLDENGATLLSLNLYHAPSKSGTGPFCIFGIHLTQAVHSIRWMKNQQRSMKSAPLVHLRTQPGRPANGSAFMEAVALKKSGGAFLFPTDLGGGHLRAICKNTSTLRWSQSNGTSFETPPATETTVWLDHPLVSLQSTNPETEVPHLERRLESISPINAVGLDRALLTLFGEGRSKRSIEVRGENLNPAKVELADYPGGAKMAAVLSWDDGVPQDIPAAKLMQRHGWRATFFLNHHSPMVGQSKELTDLGMEIGSHSWSHPFYPLQSPERCHQESVMMRKFLESKVNHPVISFAYPFNYGPAFDQKGDYVLRAQSDAGYLSCRSTMNGPLALDSLGDPLALKTNGHFLMGREKIEAEWQRALTTRFGIFYVWGHTYEIAKEEDWKNFEDLLHSYGKRPQTWYASQGDLMVWKRLREETHISASGDSTRMEITVDTPTLHPWWAGRVPIAIQTSGNVSAASSSGVQIPLAGRDLQFHLPANP